MPDIDSTSRFKLSEVILAPNGAETFALMTRFSFLDKQNLAANQILKISVNATIAGRPDIISNSLYGTPMHFWVLILFNNVINPFGWPKNGSMILAPSRDVVIPEL